MGLATLASLPTAPWRRTVFRAVIGLLVAFHAYRFWSIYVELGLFRRLGFDWALFFAQALALRSGESGALYDMRALDRYLQVLTPYTANPDEPLVQWPVPYPPLFAWLLIPFTLPPPPLGFALWTGVNLVAALHLGFRISQLLPDLGKAWAVLVVLAPVPVAWALYLGQPSTLLAVPVAEGYLALRAARDFQAGLWLSLLLFKPQYLILLGPLLLWKRRWAAVAGAAVGTMALLAGCALAAGLPALLAYPAALSEMSDFRNPFAGPGWMINWRAMVLAARPSIADQAGVLLVMMLAGLTVLGTMSLWRGRWEPQDLWFPAKFCAVVLATLLSSYHSHLHGATLSAVPLAAAWAHGNLSRFTRLSILAAVFLPSLILVGVAVFWQRLRISHNDDPLWLVWPEAFPALLLLACFGGLLADLWLSSRSERRLRRASAGPASQRVAPQA